MWIIFKPPDKPTDSVLLGVHSETFVELGIEKIDTYFRVVLHKSFDAHGSNQSTLFYILGIFDSYKESMEFALDIVEKLKNGEPCYETQNPFLPVPAEKTKKSDKAYN